MKKLAITREEAEDKSVDIEIQRELEKDMYIRSDEYTEEELDRAEAIAEMAWDAYKETHDLSEK